MIDMLIWLAISFAMYLLALLIYNKAHYQVLLHPMIVSAGLILLVIISTQSDIQTVVDDIGLLHWLLGPVTVALAIPIYRQMQLVKQLGISLFYPILLGGLFAPICAFSLLFILKSAPELQLTVLTKSITTPLAMDTAQIIGGIPAIAAIIVVMTGIVGVLCSALIFKLAKVKDDAVKGLILGVFAHGIGTAKALQISETTGAFASLALGINGVFTAVILSLLLS